MNPSSSTAGSINAAPKVNDMATDADKSSRRPRSGLPGCGFRRVAWVLFLAIFFLSGTIFAAESAPRKAVRVPCQEFNRQMIVDESGQPVSGYAYDFIQTIATYAGWDVEFVPCDNFFDGIRQLQDGDADVYYEVSYTEERAKSLLFPDEPMGFEYYYLYASQDNTSIVPDDYSTLDGKSVGVTTGTIQIGLLEQWAWRKNIRLRIVEYDGIPEKEDALRSGEVDLDLEVSMLAKSDLAAVAKIGSSSYFLVASKLRPDLVDDINLAMEKVINNDLYYFTRLQERYFSNTVLSRNLTRDEKDWIDSHSRLRVGYFDNYLPFCERDNLGRPCGAVIDAIREIVHRLKLDDRVELEFICYDDQLQGYKAVESGEIDIMVPAYLSSSVRRDFRIVGGRVLLTLACDFAFLDGREIGQGNDLRIGVNRHNLMQDYYTRDAHPLAQIVYYDDIHACLDGILGGTSDGTFLNGLRTAGLLKAEKYQLLGSMRGRHGFEFHMAFAQDNLGLLLLMNRGLTMLEPDFINKAAYTYAGRIYTPSLLDLLRKHILAAILAGAILAALLVALAGSRLSNRRLEEINQALTEYSETIEEQRLKEADLRNELVQKHGELERKQGELEDALHMAQTTYNEKTDVLTDLEDASELARLASFHYDFTARKRTGSNLVRELWPEDATGRALLEEEFVYPDDIPIFKQNVAALLEKKSKTVQFSFRVGSTSDNLRYYRMKLSLDPRKPNAVVGIVQDVTELAESMLKLKDTQALWDAAINSIPIMFSVKDIDDGFRYLLCNKEFSGFFHFSPDEIVGKTDRDLFHDDNILGFTDQVNIPTTGTGGLMEIEGDIPDGSGNLRYVKSILRGFKDARGHHLLLAASNDITDMHRLLQDRSTLNKLLESIIGETDFDLCIRRTLETVCKILGASRAFLIRHEEDGAKAHCIAEYVEPAHPHASVRMLDRTLPRVRGLMESTQDLRTFVCSDFGAFDWTLVGEDWHRTALDLDLRASFLSNIVGGGEVWGTVGFDFEGVDHTFTDNDIALLRATSHMIEVVLARKRAQDLTMEALAHARAADKAKSYFIASVSHEIRTPLNSVIGFAELLRDGGVSRERQKEYLDAISTSANALLMLVNDVLDLSKLEANQMQIVRSFTDFNALCREVMLIFTFRARENGNRLLSDVPDDLPELDIDHIRIRQILINLFGNAVKFTKDGTITLHAAFTPDPAPADTGTLRFSVTDTGIGISEEDQKKLMEPFVQLSGLRGTNAANNGTGLGLSISKRLAVRMGGELTCTSHVGEGSTFTVTLDAVRYRAKTTTLPAVPERPAPCPIARDAKTLRILIVDDVPMNLHVAKALFGKIGFQNITTAGSGQAALELLGQQPVDLILSDLWMPGMDGAAFSAAVKRNPDFAHIPIVAQTADVETGGNFDMSHFDAVILKPLTTEKLSRMVKRIIEDGSLHKPPGGAPLNLG